MKTVTEYVNSLLGEGFMDDLFEPNLEAYGMRRVVRGVYEIFDVKPELLAAAYRAQRDWERVKFVKPTDEYLRQHEVRMKATAKKYYRSTTYEYIQRGNVTFMIVTEVGPKMSDLPEKDISIHIYCQNRRESFPNWKKVSEKSLEIELRKKAKP